MIIGTSGSEEKSSICASYASSDGGADITVAGDRCAESENKTDRHLPPLLSGLRASFNWSVQITCYDTPQARHRRRRRQKHLITVEMAVEGTHAADVEFLVRRSMTKGYQLFSLLTPPAYVTFILARKGRAQFSINRFLRATWVGGAVGKLLPSPFSLWFTLVQDARLVEGSNMFGPPTPARSPSEIGTSVVPTTYVPLSTCAPHNHLFVDRIIARGRSFYHWCLAPRRPHPRSTLEEGKYDKL